MRIRPFFWLLLVFSCAGALIFSITIPTNASLVMQVQLDQQQPPTASEVTSLALHLTDLRGLPVEQAHIVSSANMTNMDMWVPPQCKFAHEVGGL